MYENIIVWSGLVLLFILCLPLARVQRLLLTLYGLGLRLGMLALVAAAAYLWFVPAQLPVEVADVVRNTPLLKSILPESGSPIFAACAVLLIAIVVLPLIAVIDVCRRKSGHENIEVREIVRVQTLPVVTENGLPTAPQPPTSSPSRFGRRAAATAMVQAGSTR